jgi:hypothetical protein
MSKLTKKYYGELVDLLDRLELNYVQSDEELVKLLMKTLKETQTTLNKIYDKRN